MLAVARSLSACLFAAAVLVSAPSRGDVEATFGDRGSFAFGGNLGVGGEQGLDRGYDTRMSLELAPAFDVFVAPHLSVGMAGLLTYSFARSSPSSSRLGVSPRVGYAVALGRLFALWPRVSLDYEYGVDAESVHHRVLSSTLFVPVDGFLLPHFAVGIGPALTQELVHRTDAGTAPTTTTVQLLVELAGWL